jgi:hypothetical protein
MNPCGKEMPLSKLSVTVPDEGVDAYSDETLAKSQNLLQLVVRTSKGAFFLTTLPGEVCSMLVLHTYSTHITVGNRR